MPPFPYASILKKAYQLTRQNLWLWVFGLFVGGFPVFNFSSVNFGETRQMLLQRANERPKAFLMLAGVVILATAVLIVLSGLAKAALIWSAWKLTDKKNNVSPVTFGKAVQIARQYAGTIILLRLAILAIFLAVFAIFALPVGYFLSIGEAARAAVLLLVGLAIFLPTSVVFGFLYIYSPIFAVVYHSKPVEALIFAFSLLRHRLKESLWLAAVLTGLNLLFIFALFFSIILISLSGALLAVGLVKAVVIALGAGFAAFQNITWVLAVQEMVKTLRLEEDEEILAAEPAGG